MNTQNKSLSEVLLPLNTMLANGEILFASNDFECENWIHVRSFYQHHGVLYAVAKDFLGTFQGGISFSTTFVMCAAYCIRSQGTVINSKGELIATCKGGCWNFAPPGTKFSSKFPRQGQSDQNVNNDTGSTGNDCNDNNIQQAQRLTANYFYQWIRHIFPKKCSAVG